MSSPRTTAWIGYALVVSNDSVAIEQLMEGMQQFAIGTEVCVDDSLAAGLLQRRQFEAVIVDLKLGAPAHSLLETVRLSPSNRTSVTFAITDAGVPAFLAQPSFVMERPLSSASINRILKAAYGLIVRERRRYFRCPVTCGVTIGSDAKEIRCETVNISEGGLAVNTSAPLRPGSLVRVRFALPDLAIEITAESEICWYQERGRAGIRFRSISPELQSELQEWLAQKLEECLPESVRCQFRK